MVTKRQLTITAVAALIVSVSLLYSVATATTSTTITIAPSNANPAVNQVFTISGTLKAGSTPLSGKSIKLSRNDPSGNYSVAGTTTTDKNGAYTFTRSESVQGHYYYQANFAGDTTYGRSIAGSSVNVGA
jgi:hypothetical protein